MRYIIKASNRHTGKEVECFTWIGYPAPALDLARHEARERGHDLINFRCIPLCDNDNFPVDFIPSL